MLVDYEESLAQVQRLLGLFLGVEVVSIQRTPRHTHIRMAIRSQDSLERLAHLSAAANVLLVVATDRPSRRYGAPGHSEDLRYELRLPKDPKRRTPPTTLQKVGIFLARELKALKLLDAHEADRLQVEWNAGVV